MDENQAFLAAIAADPYDQVTRLVYADWLDEHDAPEAADWQRTWTPERQRAEEWLKEFAAMHDIPYQEFLDAGTIYLDEGVELDVSMDASNAMYDYNHDDDVELDGEVFLDKYWRCWELVTGRKLGERERPPDPFNCACI